MEPSADGAPAMEMHQLRCFLAILAIALGAGAASAETLVIGGVTRTFIA